VTDPNRTDRASGSEQRGRAFCVSEESTYIGCCSNLPNMRDSRKRGSRKNTPISGCVNKLVEQMYLGPNAKFKRAKALCFCKFLRPPPSTYFVVDHNK